MQEHAGAAGETTPFSLVDAHSAGEAVALLGMHGPNAHPVAAGGDLLDLLRAGVLSAADASPLVLVNLATARDLSHIVSCDDGLQLGAMLTLAQLRREPRAPTMLHDAIDHVASQELRTHTTLGGNLLQRPRCSYFRNPAVDCFKKRGTSCPAAAGPPESYPGALFPGVCHAAHPSDLAAVLIALDAQAEIASWEGLRRQPLHELYRDAAFNRTAEVRMSQDEVLTSIIVPRWTDSQAFEAAVANVPNDSTSIGTAVALEFGQGVIRSARVVSSGIAPGPFLFTGAEALLTGRCPTEIDASQLARHLLPAARVNQPVEAKVAAARLTIERALNRILSRTERRLLR